MKIVHLVNVLTPRDGSDLCLAQPVTLESLMRAKESSGSLEVRVVSTQFPEDRRQVPSWMETTDDLQESSLAHSEFTDKRKLPSLREIWSRLLSCSQDSDLLIFSNIDIAVYPDFYSNLTNLINQGWESISVTRRTISNTYSDVSQLTAMWEEKGTAHPGDDCFAIRRDCASRLNIQPVYTGAGWFDKILLINLAWQTNFKKFRDERITFHIGDDRTWQNPEAKTVADWNKRLLRELILEIEQERGKSYWNPQIWPHVASVYKHAGFSTSYTYRAMKQLNQLKSRLKKFSLRTNDHERA